MYTILVKTIPFLTKLARDTFAKTYKGVVTFANRMFKGIKAKMRHSMKVSLTQNKSCVKSLKPWGLNVKMDYSAEQFH